MKNNQIILLGKHNLTGNVFYAKGANEQTAYLRQVITDAHEHPYHSFVDALSTLIEEEEEGEERKGKGKGQSAVSLFRKKAAI